MTSNFQKIYLDKLIDEFNYSSYKKYKLIAIFGLLGDFDSFEYAINLRNFIQNGQNKDVDIFAIAIGNESGKRKFCKFTGFPSKNLKVVSDNSIHNSLNASRGLELGLGVWFDMLIMLSGIYSLKTLKEVIRGYTGDRKANQIFSDFDDINLFNSIKFSGSLFKDTCGDGYLRPFELATFRLKNMIEIIKNWDDYILSSNFLPQRGATFVLNSKNQIVYEYFSNEILGYSPRMNKPLEFLIEISK